MSFVKIAEPGWGNYTGNLGGVEFVDSVSVRVLSDREIDRIGASLRLELLDSDTQLSPALKRERLPVEVVETKTDRYQDDDYTQTDLFAEDLPVHQRDHWTQELLEAVADKGGIVELRKVAEQYNVKGKSITQLINGIIGVNAQ